MKLLSEKQSWKPFIKKILLPNVPWGWYIANLVVSLGMVLLYIRIPELEGRIMAGEIFNHAMLFEYIALNLLALAVGAAYGVSESWAGIWTERKIQNRLWGKLVRLPMRQYDKQSPSSLISRVTNDTMQITYALGYVFMLITEVFSLVMMILTIAGMSGSIALSLLLVMPYIALITIIPGRFKFRAAERIQECLATFTTFVAERFSNIKLVKSAACEDADLQIGYEAAEECFKAEVKFALIDGASQPFTYSAEGIVGAIVLIFGSIMVKQGNLPMEDLITMFLYSSSIYTSMIQFIFCFHELKKAQGATSKITELVDLPSEEPKREISFTQPDENIVFDNVSFRYEEKNVLQDVNLTIPKGKVTAIVGPSGAGKTTILSLLERLYTPDCGQILFGDVPAEKIHLDEWRGATGYIQQSSPLLSGTIRENITYGLDREATDAEVIRAAQLANAYDFITKLPEGFDSDIGQLGGKLSGGERQRIAIARMIIKDPTYVLLDEATSNLDAENEAEVQAALNNMMQGRTAVVVAHNMRTVVNADQIIVLDQGRVQAIGNHESLYASNRLYKRYFDLQFAQ